MSIQRGTGRPVRAAGGLRPNSTSIAAAANRARDPGRAARRVRGSLLHLTDPGRKERAGREAHRLANHVRVLRVSRPATISTSPHVRRRPASGSGAGLNRPMSSRLPRSSVPPESPTPTTATRSLCNWSPSLDLPRTCSRAGQPRRSWLRAVLALKRTLSKNRSGESRRAMGSGERPCSDPEMAGLPRLPPSCLRGIFSARNAKY